MNAISQDDTITFELKAEKTVVNDTVKIVANVEVLVTDPAMTEEALRAEIRKTLRSFCETDWQFSNVNRSKDTTGFERVGLTASARVSETENYNLQDRANAVSRQGLKISHVFADTSVPTAMIEAAERELRARIYESAMKEAKELSELGFRHWRIGSVDFTMQRNNTQNGRLAMMATTKAAYGSGFDMDDEGILGNASKITMVASVTLASRSYETYVRT